MAAPNETGGKKEVDAAEKAATKEMTEEEMLELASKQSLHEASLNEKKYEIEAAEEVTKEELSEEEKIKTKEDGENLDYYYYWFDWSL